MRRIILPSVACPAVPYFSKLSHKRHDYRENFIEHKMCVLTFSTTFVSNIYHSMKNSARYYHVKCPLFFSDYNKTLIFSTDFRKILKYQTLRKSVQLEPSCSMRRHRRTDITYLIVAFRNAANANVTRNARACQESRSLKPQETQRCVVGKPHRRQ